MKRFFLLLAALLLPGAALADTAVKVTASIPPHMYMAERIAGPRAELTALVKPGQNPHTYEPTPRQVAELAKSQLFLAVDMPFEKMLLPRLRELAPQMKVVDLQDGLKLRKFTKAELEAHKHEEKEDEHEHDHGHHNHGHGHDEDLDPHSWLNPRLALQQAGHIRDALSQLDPAGAPEYQANYKKLAAELKALDKELAQSLKPLKGKALLVYHPAFGYFADAYGMRQVAVEHGGKEPTARQLSSLIELARREEVKVIFIQPQYSPESARAISEQIGATVVTIDDLGQDYLANLRDIASKVRAAQP